MATPFSTAGIRWQINVNGTFTNIPKMDGFQIQTAGKPTIDTTGLEDVADTSVGGNPDNGTANGTIFFDPRDATHMLLFAHSQTANTTDQFKVILPFSGANNTVSFSGEILNMGLDGQKKAAFKSPFSIKVSGAFTWS